MKELWKRTVWEHRIALARKEYSSVELTGSYLHRIAQVEGDVGAFLHLDEAGALEAATASDQRRASGKILGELEGIPFALKDNICVKGMPLTCGSLMLRDYIAPYDATVTQRLLQAGGVLLGKTNMDEFAMGSSTEYSALGVSKNPHNLQCVTGGSSGGSAAAVAANEVPFALGTDTGGSVRQPAAFCGVYGLRPTYGLISRYGVTEMASSMDCVGLMASTVKDCAVVLSALVGFDKRDATSLSIPKREYFSMVDQALPPLRIAVPNIFYSENIDSEVLSAMERAVTCLANRGAQVEVVSLPLPMQALAAYTVLSSAEASSNLGRYDGIHLGTASETADTLSKLYQSSRGEGFGKEAKRRILFGVDVLSDANREKFYVRAERVRDLVRREMLTLSKQFDVIVTPTAPSVAFSRQSTQSPEQIRLSDLCTMYASLAGLPALSVPFGVNSNGMPLAVQLMGRALSEDVLFRAARYLEEDVSNGTGI